MPRAKRRWDVIEIHAERGLSFAFFAVLVLAFAWLLWRFPGTGTFAPLMIVMFLLGLVLLGFAVNKAIDIRKVASYPVICPLCEFENELVSEPTTDFVCANCERMVPIADGKPMEVKQAKCKACGQLNYYSEKTEFLICEVCNHKIDIDTAASRTSTGPRAAESFVVTDDTNIYEFVLLAHGHKTEDLIDALQHMLALNRNQVKQMLSELPVTLLTGITRRKAEILQAQLALHEAATEFRPMTTV